MQNDDVASDWSHWHTHWCKIEDKIGYTAAIVDTCETKFRTYHQEKRLQNWKNKF